VTICIYGTIFVLTRVEDERRTETGRDETRDKNKAAGRRRYFCGQVLTVLLRTPQLKHMSGGEYEAKEVKDNWLMHICAAFYVHIYNLCLTTHLSQQTVDVQGSDFSVPFQIVIRTMLTESL
jgi:hypothetical protein